MATARQLLDAKLGAEGFNMLAWTIATEMDEKDRDLSVALTAANKAVEATKGEDPTVLDTQARVYWEMGNAGKAAEIQANAIKLAKQSDLPKETLSELEAAMKRYQGDKKPN
jgi:predicted Zn-dependent protease